MSPFRMTVVNLTGKISPSSLSYMYNNYEILNGYLSQISQELFGALERSLAGTWTVFCEQDATAGTRAPELRAWSGYQVCQPSNSPESNPLIIILKVRFINRLKKLESIFNITWTENFEQKEKRKRAKDDADTESSEQWKKQSRILEQKKDNAVFRNVIDDGLRVASAHENLIAGMLCPLKSSKPSYEQGNCRESSPSRYRIPKLFVGNGRRSQLKRRKTLIIHIIYSFGEVKNPNYVTKPLKPSRQPPPIPSPNKALPQPPEIILERTKYINSFT
ncbi:10209_t:CDS:2 [Funneliformis geosporum]|uniref:10209_t:CDS:1 n=1 Tax=Funneliformis geosporum TaxID=1117311 RepID=A0A9W4T7H3_9GLOM|nr:10209_t:CDS:2 [Funneliformis geosporum]